MTTVNETALDLILRAAYRDHQETNDPKNRYRMICLVCNYVPRSGGFTAFSVQADKTQCYCFACGNGGGHKETLGHLSGIDPHTYELPKVAPPAFSPKGQRPGPALLGATLEQPCRTKGLDLQWCREQLGWRSGFRYKTKAVEMPYFDKQGNEHLVRCRVGIHGASSYTSRWNQYFQGLELYVWREPGPGGDTFVDRISDELGKIKVVSAPQKDPCEFIKSLGVPA